MLFYRKSYILVILVFAIFFLEGCIKRKFFVRKDKQEIPVKELYSVAIVLDDAGNTRECLFDIEEINFPVTIAVLPSVSYSQKFCYVENSHVKKIA